MNGLATITSKRQLTIPVRIFRLAGFKEKQKVFVKKLRKGIKIEPAFSVIEKLAGSVEIPRKYKGMQPDEIVKEAKKEYFSGRKK